MVVRGAGPGRGRGGGAVRHQRSGGRRAHGHRRRRFAGPCADPGGQRRATSLAHDPRHRGRDRGHRPDGWRGRDRVAGRTGGDPAVAGVQRRAAHDRARVLHLADHRSPPRGGGRRRLHRAVDRGRARKGRRRHPRQPGRAAARRRPQRRGAARHRSRGDGRRRGCRSPVPGARARRPSGAGRSPGADRLLHVRQLLRRVPVRGHPRRVGDAVDRPVVRRATGAGGGALDHVHQPDPADRRPPRWRVLRAAGRHARTGRRGDRPGGRHRLPEPREPRHQPCHRRTGGQPVAAGDDAGGPGGWGRRRGPRRAGGHAAVRRQQGRLPGQARRDARTRDASHAQPLVGPAPPVALAAQGRRERRKGRERGAAGAGGAGTTPADRR